MISLITVCYNAKDHIGKCLQSIAESRGCTDYEHIIIDGGSSDGTIDIIKEYACKYPNVRCQSEPDGGSSDAFNKGVRLAKGEFIGFLNADDWYFSKTLALVSSVARKAKNDILVFDAIYHWPDRAMRIKSNPSRMNWEMTVTHPATFIRRSLFGKIGYFDVSKKLAMDYDLLLRCLFSSSRISYFNLPVVNMAMGGISDRQWVKALWECYFSRRRMPSSPVLLQPYYLLKILRGYASRFQGPKWLMYSIWWFKRRFSINKAIEVSE